jgi:peptidoglycan/LPS O-acetylase OafA/YrhL
VLPVILFHLNVPLFRGGFIGVDIFFVISGYLITRLIANDLDRGRFSITTFYQRRIRRIVPALACMFVVTTIGAAWLMLPYDFKFYAISLGGATASLSNLFFWMKSDYFAAADQNYPLLHTWSLAVEEQYYIVFPLLLAAFARYRPQWRAGVVWLLFLASFAFSIYQLRTDPTGAFYLPFGRWWELMTGSLLALGQVPAVRQRIAREALATAGAAMLVAGFLLLDESVPFPGPAALLPCLGSAMLIHANSEGGTALGRWLGSPVPRGIGLLSYSLYLWHWPFVILLRYVVMRPLTLAETIGVLAATCAASFLSWRYVERPFREAQRGRGIATQAGTRPLLAGGATAAILLALAGAIWISGGAPWRLTPEQRGYAVAQSDRNPRREECDAHSPLRVATGDLCAIGDPAAPVDFALVGDSMADSLFPGIDSAAHRTHRRGLAFVQSGCLVMPGIGDPGGKCRKFGDAAFAYIAAHPEIRSVLIVHRWAGFVEGRRFGLVNTAIPPSIDDLTGPAPTPEQGRAAFGRSLIRLRKALKGRDVTLLAYIPEQWSRVPQAAVMGLRFGDGLPKGVSRAEYLDRNARTRAIIDGLSRQAGYHVLDGGNWLCNAGTCPSVDGGRSLYIDDVHLTASAAIAHDAIFAAFLSAPIRR